MDREGQVVDERWTRHSGAGITELITWLCDRGGVVPSVLAIAIELPRGANVEALTESGFAVLSIHPKLLDHFRDRYSPAGLKTTVVTPSSWTIRSAQTRIVFTPCASTSLPSFVCEICRDWRIIFGTSNAGSTISSRAMAPLLSAIAHALLVIR